MRHLCVLRVFLMNGIFLFFVYEVCGELLVRYAGTFLSLRHLSVHRVLDIPVFASFCLHVCCTCLGLS